MFKRLRRLRSNPNIRQLVCENHLDVNDLIYPLFVTHGKNIKNAIESMPDVFQLSLDNILRECEILESLGINAIMLFGIPRIKDSIGSEALSQEGIVAQGVR
ncbi:MAG: porphobilinogen synthase, partial [Helicobacter sp.]|nr:porphobilinogen synthase [Helicobacter sp.]